MNLAEDGWTCQVSGKFARMSQESCRAATGRILGRQLKFGEKLGGGVEMCLRAILGSEFGRINSVRGHKW